jgi:hypothetical protein
MQFTGMISKSTIQIKEYDVAIMEGLFKTNDSGLIVKCSLLSRTLCSKLDLSMFLITCTQS